MSAAWVKTGCFCGYFSRGEVSLADGRHSCTDALRTRFARRKNVTVQKAPKCGALAPKYRRFLQSFTGTTSIYQLKIPCREK